MNKKAVRKKSPAISAAQSRVDTREAFIKLSANFEDHCENDARMFDEISKTLIEIKADIKLLLGEKNQRDGEAKMKRGMLGAAMVIIPSIITLVWHYLLGK